MNEILYLEKFDTEILQLNTARLKLSKSMPELGLDKNTWHKFISNHQIKFVICSTIPNEANLTFLAEQDFKFVSIKSLYEFCEIQNNQYTLPSDFEIKSENEISFDKNKIEWIELMHVIGSTSHYAKNEQLPKNTCSKIYSKWFENTFSGHVDRIFTINFRNEIAGFISLKIRNEQIFIELLGVREKFNNKGLGSILTNQAIDYAKALNKKIYVYTQGENIAANRCYQKNGFRIKNIELIYHKVL